jgi:hypothetical protein
MKIDKITCVICGEETSEINYPEHMATVHSGKTQLEALQQEKEIEQNIPKVIPLEIPLDPNAPLPPEFAEVVAMIDAGPKPKTLQQLPETKPVEPKPLKLKYVWEGNCPTCNTSVRTIVTKIDGRWFVSAFCISHETIDQREVTPLEEKIQFKVLDTGPERATGEDCLKEKEAKNERKPSVSKKTPK